MKNLRLGTWNIKNSYYNLTEAEMKAHAVTQLLKEKDLDILTLQEVNPILARKIEKRLKELNMGYEITSEYRKTLNPISNLLVEYNIIISGLEPIMSSSNWGLPFIPKEFKLDKLSSIHTRKLTSQLLSGRFFVNTTHLDYAFDELNKRQMQEVISEISSLKQYDLEYDIFLTGNLNRKPTEQNMIEFTKQINDLNLKVVENNIKTYIEDTENQPVDYIIIPNNWEVDSVETVQGLDDISSHKPVIAAIKKR